MNRTLQVRTIAAIFLFGCYSLLAAAQSPAEPPAQASSASSSATSEVPPADDSGKKSFRLKIDADA